MKKIELICSLTKEGNIGGETIKNEYLYEYLKDNNINIKLLDFEKYKKIKIILVIKCILSIINPFSRKIILSKASKSAYLYLKLYYYLNIWNKKLYYFVIGGNFHNFLLEKKFKLKYYKNLEKIYVETIKMKRKLNDDLNLKQVEYLPNFKKFDIKDRSNKQITLPLKCVFFSRIEEKKGVELIFKMLSEVNKEETKVEVDFYGPIKDDYKKVFEKKIKEYNEIKYCGILNTREERTYDILSEYDLMLFPTYWEGEGFPGTIIDAYISSLPVLASDNNFNSEIIIEGETGFIFLNKNQSSFNKKLLMLIKNQQLLYKIRKNCIKISLNYEVNKVLLKLLKEIQ